LQIKHRQVDIGLTKSPAGSSDFPEAVFDGAPGALKF
jgi:hypothetical protein